MEFVENTMLERYRSDNCENKTGLPPGVPGQAMYNEVVSEAQVR